MDYLTQMETDIYASLGFPRLTDENVDEYLSPDMSIYPSVRALIRTGHTLIYRFPSVVDLSRTMDRFVDNVNKLAEIMPVQWTLHTRPNGSKKTRDRYPTYYIAQAFHGASSEWWPKPSWALADLYLRLHHDQGDQPKAT